MSCWFAASLTYTPTGYTRSRQYPTGVYGASRPMKHEHHEHSHRGRDRHVAGTAVDPVCGMTVKIEGARHTHRHGTRTHYFCSRALSREVHRRIRSAISTPLQRPRCGGRSQSPSRKARSTPAPCIPRSCRRGRALARSAAWRSSPRACRRPMQAPIRSSSISRTACGSAPPSPSRSSCSPWVRTSACRCTAGFRRKLRAGSS